MESLNRMRLDPQGELDVIFSSLQPLRARDPSVQGAIQYFNVSGPVLLQQWSELTPVPPLAWNENLTLAAEGHNAMMVQFDQQEHQLPGEPALGDRVRNVGYQFQRATENIYAFAESHIHGHAGFVVDWGEGPGGIQTPAGHRDNYMDPAVVEVGIDVISESNVATSVGPYLVTQDFGRPRTLGQPFVLGVVWTDSNRNSIYDPGEGHGGVDIVVSGPGGTYQAQTMTAGGYQVRVPAGTYQVLASGGGLAAPYAVANVLVGKANVKADVETGSGIRPPVAVADSASGTPSSFLAIRILDNDSDPDGLLDPASVVISRQPTQGTVTVNPDSGVATLYPNGSATGGDSFSYTVRDRTGLISNEASVSIRWANSQQPPVADSVTRNGVEDEALDIDLSGAVHDPEGNIDWDSLEIVAAPKYGTATVSVANRTIRFVPLGDYAGTDTLTYRVTDATGLASNTAVITLQLAPRNDPPQAIADTFVIPGDAFQVLEVAQNDLDVDDSLTQLSVLIVAASLHGTTNVEGNRIRYSPTQGFVGLDSLSYQVRDPGGLTSNTVTSRILVIHPNQPWQNPLNAKDVDWNNVISPVDALLVINNLGLDLSRDSDQLSSNGLPPPFVDVDGNQRVTPLDALLVINDLGTQNPGSSLSSSAEPVDAVLADLASVGIAPGAVFPHGAWTAGPLRSGPLPNFLAVYPQKRLINGLTNSLPGRNNTRRETPSALLLQRPVSDSDGAPFCTDDDSWAG